jgi:hypothetical protein
VAGDCWICKCIYAITDPYLMHLKNSGPYPLVWVCLIVYF